MKLIITSCSEILSGPFHLNLGFLICNPLICSMNYPKVIESHWMELKGKSLYQGLSGFYIVTITFKESTTVPD